MKNYPLNSAPSFINMRELVEYIDENYKNNIAYSYRINPTDIEIQTRTFARLCEDVRCLTTALVESGIAGGHIALIGRLSYGWVCTYLAVLCAGAVLVPLDPDWGENELSDTVKSAECTSLFCCDELFGGKAETIAKNAKIKYVFAIDSDSPQGISSLIARGKELRAEGDTTYESTRIAPDKLSLLVFTSGTTGKGKGVMLSQTAIISNITSGMRLIKISSRTIGVLPPHHTFGSTLNLLGNLLYGVNMYISSGVRYLPKEMKEHKPTHLVLVPLYLETFYRRIMASVKESGKEGTLKQIMTFTNALNKIGIDVRRSMFKTPLAAFGGELTTIITGGAPLSNDIYDTFEALGLKIVNGYGITECSPILSANRDKLTKRGSIGLALPGIILKVKDPDENGEGELCAKGPNVMLGYYKDPAATAAAFDEDGYFCTGDIGKKDKDGWYYITGRIKNLIILSNGKNVYPEEIESELALVPGVLDVVVYEGISKRGGEHNAIVAEIFPDAAYIEKNKITDKQAYFKEHINKYNKTAVAYKKIGILKIRETDFPKNTLRKITRFKIDKTID